MCTPWIELVLMWGLSIGQTKHYKFKPFWNSYVGVMRIRWFSNFQWKQFIHTVESFDFVGANFVDILPICGDVILLIHGFSVSKKTTSFKIRFHGGCKFVGEGY